MTNPHEHEIDLAEGRLDEDRWRAARGLDLDAIKRLFKRKRHWLHGLRRLPGTEHIHMHKGTRILAWSRSPVDEVGVDTILAHIDNLHEGTRALVAEVERLRAENAELVGEIEARDETIDEQADIVAELRERLEVVGVVAQRLAENARNEPRWRYRAGLMETMIDAEVERRKKEDADGQAS